MSECLENYKPNKLLLSKYVISKIFSISEIQIIFVKLMYNYINIYLHAHFELLEHS